MAHVANQEVTSLALKEIGPAEYVTACESTQQVGGPSTPEEN